MRMHSYRQNLQRRLQEKAKTKLASGSRRALILLRCKNKQMLAEKSRDYPNIFFQFLVKPQPVKIVVKKNWKMVQSEIIQIDVAFLTYNPMRCADTPLVNQDNSCLAGLHELRKHRDIKRRDRESMGPEAYHHYKWYNGMLMHELKGPSENAKLKVIHWHIESGNTEAFMMGGVLYKAVSIIIGTEMEHWYCANTGKNGTHSYGSRYRTSDRQQHETNTKKIACFTIDDDEATLVVKPSTDSLTKCTKDVCVNNCVECKKFRSPFTKTNSKSSCVCFPSSEEFRSIIESDLESDSDSDDPDIAYLPSTFFGRKGKFNPKFKLNAIHEESIIN